MLHRVTRCIALLLYVSTVDVSHCVGGAPTERLLRQVRPKTSLIPATCSCCIGIPSLRSGQTPACAHINGGAPYFLPN